MERDNPPFQAAFTHQIAIQDAFTHQIWNAHLKECKRCAPDTRILKTRSKVNVTVTRNWYVKLCHPKMHFHNKLEFLPQRIYMRYAPDSKQFLETRSEVKVNVTGTQGWCATLCQPKMHQRTKFGIPTSNNIGDMLRTRLF